MTTWTREPSFGNTTRLTGRQVTVVSNSGFTPLLNANDTLTIEAPSINLSTFPDLSGTNGRINFLKSDGTTTIAVETENNLLNMNSHKITNVLAGVAGTDAVNLTQMNTAISAGVGGTSYAITRGGGSVTAEITGQITVSPPVGQATIMTVAGVTKATLNTTNLTMAVPIAMDSNKISGLTTATNNDEATNKGQMDSAIATALGGLTTYSISRGGGSATAEITGQMSINVPTGQATIMNVNSVPKATFNTTNLTMAVPIAMGNNKITGLTAGTGAGDGIEYAQMNTAIGTAVSNAYSITRASGSVTVGTSGQIINTVVAGQFQDTIVGGTRYVRTNAINGTGFSGGIGTELITITSQPIYVSGPAISPAMNIGYSGSSGTINSTNGNINVTSLSGFVVKGLAGSGLVLSVQDSTGLEKISYNQTTDLCHLHAETIVRPVANTTTAFTVKRAGGSTVVSVDTTNDLVNMNSHKITNVLAGTTATTDACNVTQMESAVATAISGISTYSISRGGGSATAETTGQLTLIAPTGQSIISQINGVTKLTVNGTGVSVGGPIAMGANKITGLTAGTVAGDVIEYSQMNTAIGTAVSPYLLSATASTTYATQASVATAIAQVHQPYEITRGGGSAIAESAGQISINVPTGQATIMNVNSVPKATFNGTALTMAMPIAMGANKITGLTAGATATTDACNVTQMEAYVASATGGSSNFTYSVVNGDMAVNQRNNGLVSIHGTYIVDRWFGSEPTGSTGTAQQLLLDNVECPPNTNFRQCLRILGNNANANTSVLNDIVQNIEGKPWGEIVNPQLTTPGGVPTQTYRQVSLSFWARSSVTSYKFSVSAVNTNQTTGQYRDVTTGTANTWARYTVTFTSGSRPTSSGFDFTNGVLSSKIRVMYAKGSSQAILRGSTAGIWNNLTLTYSISNVTFDQLTAGTTFDIVGFQWDVGAVAQPYKHIMYNDQLLACQRYYYRITSNSTTYLLGSAGQYNSSYQILIIPFKTHMRIAPLFSVSSATCISQFYGPNASYATATNIVDDWPRSRECATVVLVITTTNGGGYAYFNAVGAYIAFNAE